jgi:hypothetical protein
VRDVPPFWVLLAAAPLACGGAVDAEHGTDSGARALDATTDAPGPAVDSGEGDDMSLVPIVPDACSPDLQNDPFNCGACGHDCSPAGCSGGACTATPTVLAKVASPEYVAVDSAGVYWSANGSPRTIQQCPLDGCSDAGTSVWSGTEAVDALAVQGGFVVWPATAGLGPVTSGIVSCATTGCTGAPTVLVLLPGLSIAGFGIDSTSAYFSTGPIKSCALAGCNQTASTFYEFPDASADGALVLAVGGGNVVWRDEAGNLETCPTSGCPGAPFVVGTVSQRMQQLAVDDTHVYWLDPGIGPPAKSMAPYTDGRVLACPLTGCGAGPTVLASYAAWWQTGVIASDGLDVYWTYEDQSANFGALVRCAVGGCAGQPTTLAITATKYSPTYGLALDATHVYWTDPGSGEVLSLAK